MKEITEIWEILDRTLADLHIYLGQPKADSAVNLFGAYYNS